MEKFFQAIKRLRPAVQAGKTSRDDALKILMQESGVSEDVAARAADNMIAAKPEVSGGISSLKPDVTFSSTQKKLPDPIDMSVEERTGGLLTETEAPGLYSLRRDIESLADEESWKYSMAKWRQDRAKKMEPIYKKYGAATERDRALLDEYIEMDVDGNITMSSSNPKYDKSTASIFIQESAEEAAGQAGADIAANVLYSRPAENILMDEGLDAYIDYAFKELKKEGLTFNRNLLKKVLKEKYGAKDTPEGFANGGRIGFAEGVGRKGILSGLADKLNEIAPGSTAVGKTTKAMNEAAARKRAEQELFAGFNKRLSELDKPEPSVKIIEKEAPVKAGQGKFTAAEILLERLKNTLKSEKDPYVQETFPNFIKEIEANPKLADDPKVQEAFGLRDLPENQRLVEYDDGTFDFFTKGQKRGLGSAKALADEFGISMEEAVKIQMMEPEDQVLEIQRRRALNKRNLNASGGLNYLMGF